MKCPTVVVFPIAAENGLYIDKQYEEVSCPVYFLLFSEEQEMDLNFFNSFKDEECMQLYPL